MNHLDSNFIIVWIKNHGSRINVYRCSPAIDVLVIICITIWNRALLSSIAFGVRIDCICSLLKVIQSFNDTISLLYVVTLQQTRERKRYERTKKAKQTKRTTGQLNWFRLSFIFFYFGSWFLCLILPKSCCCYLFNRIFVQEWSQRNAANYLTVGSIPLNTPRH